MDEHSATSTTIRGGNIIALFLGLYLLVLAFFVFLVSISTPEEVRSKAVMDSLSSTFAPILPPSTDLTSFTAREGEVVAAQMQSDIGGIFTTAVQVAKVEIISPGKLMRVVLPADSLFFPDTTDIRKGQQPLLDRIVAALRAVPRGMRHDMDFVIGSPYAEGSVLPTGQTLSMARAGAFARELMNRGMPPGSVSIGLKPGDPGEIVIWFHVRFRDERILGFGSD
jgi:outer membrane protein OmpA-like peptidoglycan-associated protein